MAAEHPRLHVWSGDPYSSLTWLINISPELEEDGSYYLIKSPTPVGAIAVAVGECLPISDDWDNIVIVCRPLKSHEVDKVNLKDGEVIHLDDDSYLHLISTTNGENESG